MKKKKKISEMLNDIERNRVKPKVCGLRVDLRSGEEFTSAGCSAEFCQSGFLLRFDVSGESRFADELRKTRQFCFSLYDTQGHHVVSSKLIDIPCAQSLETWGGGRIFFNQPCVLLVD